MGENVQFKFEAIGTHWEIDINKEKLINFSELKQQIKEEIFQFTKYFSRFDKNSVVYKASNQALEIKIPEKYQSLIEIYEKLYKLTEGLFTPLVGNLLVETGYDENYSLVPGKINPIPEWGEVIDFEYPTLKIKKPWVLDFGAGGKGFLVDLIGELIEKQNIISYCIDGSGDILYKTTDKNPLRVGLEHPENKTQVIGVVEIKNQSLCASAGNRRKWDKYHHIFNPNTLESVDDVRAVWVVARNGLIADCLATCLFLVEPEKLINNFKFEYLIVYKDYSFQKSLNFKGEIYYN